MPTEDHNPHPSSGEQHDESRAALEEIERTRLLAVTDPRFTGPPLWWSLTYSALYGALLGVLVVGHVLLTLGVVVLFSAGIGLLLRLQVNRQGVSTLRYRSLPAPLRRSYLPGWLLGALPVVAYVLTWFDVLAPNPVLFGAASAASLLAGLLWSSAWYRRASRRLRRAQEARG